MRAASLALVALILLLPLGLSDYRAYQLALYFLSTNAAPNGRNWANWKNEEFDKVIDRIEKSSDKAEILKDTQRAHEIIVDDAPWAFIVHDRNPRAMTKKVKGFVSAQSWFQDFTGVDMQ